MATGMLLLLISFVAGILTVLAPCVLPVLPVIIGSSLTGQKDRLRPYLVSGSLALAIIGFTLLLKVSTLLVNTSPAVLTNISGGLLIALGIVTAVPEAWERVMIVLNWQSASLRLLQRGERHKKYVGAVLCGIALGPVFASCSPTYAFILASVLPHSITSGLLYLIAYSLGLALTLLVVALVGRKLTMHAHWAIDTHSLFRRLTGVIFVLIGVLVISGQITRVETWVANRLPFDESRLENVLLAGQHRNVLIRQSEPSSASVLNVQPVPAPEFVGLTNWINSGPLTMSGLKGKIVLVDFWTYSCINCIRSLPYVEKWWTAYHDKGLVIVGINTPEFAFEHNPSNVAAAVKRDGIKYPVALDNDYATWNAFDNNSWPADYLIDRQGQIRYVSLGEGDYNVTEQAIQELLGINQPLRTPTSLVPIAQNQTPETYFGTNREQNYSGTSPLANGTFNFSPTKTLGANSWTLSGTWQIGGESITSAGSMSTLSFNVQAKDVYMVAGSPVQSEAHIMLSGQAAGEYGTDDPGGDAGISGYKLYHIVSLPKFEDTTVTVTVPRGVSLYTFTFGS